VCIVFVSTVYIKIRNGGECLWRIHILKWTITSYATSVFEISPDNYVPIVDRMHVRNNCSHEIS
jgi:hypothetical protein